MTFDLASLMGNLRRNREQDVVKIFNRALSPEPWIIDVIRYDGEVLEIFGWALAPEGRHDLLTFTVNDIEFEQRSFPEHQPEVARVFWFKPGADRSGLHCRTSITRDELFGNGYSVLKCINRETRLPVHEEFNIYYDNGDGPELPDPPRRLRVWGTVEASSFLLEGFSTFRKLDLA